MAELKISLRVTSLRDALLRIPLTTTSDNPLPCGHLGTRESL